MSQPKIAAFAGSLRSGSLNKKLIAFAAEAARAAGAEVTLVDLRDLALPLFDQDFEDATGLPEARRSSRRSCESQRRISHRLAGVQQLGDRRAEECDRLGIATERPTTSRRWSLSGEKPRR